MIKKPSVPWFFPRVFPKWFNVVLAYLTTIGIQSVFTAMFQLDLSRFPLFPLILCIYRSLDLLFSCFFFLFKWIFFLIFSYCVLLFYFRVRRFLYVNGLLSSRSFSWFQFPRNTNMNAYLMRNQRSLMFYLIFFGLFGFCRLRVIFIMLAFRRCNAMIRNHVAVIVCETHYLTHSHVCRLIGHTHMHATCIVHMSYKGYDNKRLPHTHTHTILRKGTQRTLQCTTILYPSMFF